MIWLFLCSCQEVDSKLVAIKEDARAGAWEQVEEGYIEQINDAPIVVCILPYPRFLMYRRSQSWRRQCECGHTICPVFRYGESVF